jgi:RNase P subunit RPR2
VNTTYVVNVSDTNEDGSFYCPGCKSVISPEDFSEKNYSIVEVGESEGVWAALVTCKKCGEVIRIEGIVEG